MVLCSELKNGLCKLVTKSQVVTKFNVTKLRLHCTMFTYLDLPKSCWTDCSQKDNSPAKLST